MNSLLTSGNMRLFTKSSKMFAFRRVLKVIVLKHGIIIENRNTDDLFNNPKDDYTKKLISSVPSPIPLGK